MEKAKSQYYDASLQYNYSPNLWIWVYLFCKRCRNTHWKDSIATEPRPQSCHNICPQYMTIKDLHDCTGTPYIKNHLITHARKQLHTMRQNSPIICKVIQDYNSIKHIQMNPSTLDILRWREGKSPSKETITIIRKESNLKLWMWNTRNAAPIDF